MKTLNAKIQKFIISNPTLSSQEIAKKLNVNSNIVAGNKATLTRQKNLGVDNVIKTDEVVKVKKVIKTDEEKKVIQRAYNKAYYEAKRTKAIVADVVEENEVKIVLTDEEKKARQRAYNKRYQNKKKGVVADVVEKIEPQGLFTNGDGIEKSKSRIIATNYIIDSGVVGDIATLPANNCYAEMLIHSAIPEMTFTARERKKVTLLEMRKVIRENNLPITSKLGDISEIIYGQRKNKYAHMYLDYCGELTSFEKEIKYAVKEKLVAKRGYIIITLGKPLRDKKNSTKWIKELGVTKTNNVNDNRCLSDKSIEAFFYNLIGSNYDFVEQFNYMDTYPMIMIVLRRK